MYGAVSERGGPILFPNFAFVKVAPVIIAFVISSPCKLMYAKFALPRFTLGPITYPLVVIAYGAVSGTRGVPVTPPDRTL